MEWQRAASYHARYKMPAPYLPTPDVLETDDAVETWGRDLVKLKGNQEAMLEGLRDYIGILKAK